MNYSDQELNALIETIVKVVKGTDTTSFIGCCGVLHVYDIVGNEKYDTAKLVILIVCYNE